MLDNLRLSEKALNEKLLVRRPGDFEYAAVRDIQSLRKLVMQLHSRCVELEGALATLTDSPASATLETVTLVAPERVYADALRTLKRTP